jgi:hypothetical protein
MKECLQKIRDGVWRIGVVAVQRDNDIALRLQQARFVGAAIAPDLLMQHTGPEPPCHLGSSVGGIVVDDNDLVDERRHAPQNFYDAFFLIQARYDHGNTAIFVHGRGS